MKAYVYREYGGPQVLKLETLPTPTFKDHEILVSVKATTVTSGAVWMRQGGVPYSKFFTIMIRLIFGVFSPRKKVLGFEFSGVVKQVGLNVKNFKVGDRIYGTCSGLKVGSYAEEIVVSETNSKAVFKHTPEWLNDEEAAALPIGGATAYQLLEKLGLKRGDKLLVYGASGSVGTYAVMLAEAAGIQVHAVCRIENHDLVYKLGAVQAFDYRNWNPNELKAQYNGVFDAVGYLKSTDAAKLMAKGGKFITIKTPTSEKVSILEMVETIFKANDLKPFIDRVYPFSEMVEAHRYTDTQRKRGNVVVRVNEA